MQAFVFPEEKWSRELSPTDTVALDSIGGIHIRFESNYVAQHRRIFPLQKPFLQTASACSIIPGYDGAKEEQLSKFDIISLDFWDVDHPEGSTINDLLQYRGNDWGDSDQSLISFIDSQTGLLTTESLRLAFIQGPMKAGSYRLKIDVEFTYGEEYEEEILMNVK